MAKYNKDGYYICDNCKISLYTKANGIVYTEESYFENGYSILKRFCSTKCQKISRIKE